MLDVGGSLGHYSKAFVEKEPGLKAVVLDTPEVAELGRADLEGSGLKGKLEFEGGDYLTDEWGKDYDIVLIANVLHQEDRKNAQAMIEKGASALGPGGRLAVVDFAIDDEQREHIMGALFAINMRSFGDTHTAPSIRKWMSDAGLFPIERIDLTQTRWIIVGQKPV